MHHELGVPRLTSLSGEPRSDTRLKCYCTLLLQKGKTKIFDLSRRAHEQARQSSPHGFGLGDLIVFGIFFGLSALVGLVIARFGFRDIERTAPKVFLVEL